MSTTLHALAGKPAPKELLIDLAQIERDYYDNRPDMTSFGQRVTFGTSGHRGKPEDGSFTESHILAITQAVCDYRATQKTEGPLFLGKDTHAASAAAQRTAIEVLAANDVLTRYQARDEVTPTPVISWSILEHNRGRRDKLADGLIITPSHNPPTDGGIKYNATHGGGADTEATLWIQQRANAILEGGNKQVRRTPYATAIRSDKMVACDFRTPYIDALDQIVDLKLVAGAKLRLGVDPLGGAGHHYWTPIAEKYKLDITVTNPGVDPTFAFMTVDHDGKIRMDCSSPWSMRGLVSLKDKFDLAFANDPDADRHGIVAPSVGLLNPNHVLTVAIQYLFGHRSQWSNKVKVGKTVVSSSMIDRVVASLSRTLVEVPVGFKWFVSGLYDGSLGFGGEESAGASFLRMDGSVWSTDKDGIIVNLLMAEILARTGKDPGQLYQNIERLFGTSRYTRIDQPILAEQKAAFKKLTPDKVTAKELAGQPIVAKETRAAGNGAEIGGLKVSTREGWFAARPSGTENIYKIYAESLAREEDQETHLARIIDEARVIVAGALN
ncbi:MAG: phosphoglucomutase (alpha-D-glucose-1,6-bisphosphate-dependent) [Thermoguttaceae bacterium]